ncbi:MAG: TerB family tellurite resistance protein [Flavobacteriaceae bacterium]|nr:TerB family tellurite resistance protein [Flavobacteriaceae bacterium]
MQEEYSKALLSDLIVLAKADDKFTQSEFDFIYRLSKRMEISEADFKNLLEDPLPSQPILSELQRITHFHKLVLVMNVDRETHDNEVVVLKNFGLKMGIRPAAIDRILLAMEQYEDKVIPPQELIQIFQSYYN